MSVAVGSRAVQVRRCAGEPGIARRSLKLRKTLPFSKSPSRRKPQHALGVGRPHTAIVGFGDYGISGDQIRLKEGAAAFDEGQGTKAL